MLHSSLRDCKAWQDEGLPFSTTSNEACKMYDALLTQLPQRQADLRSPEHTWSYGSTSSLRDLLQALSDQQALFMWVSWKNDSSLGGFESCTTQLQAADPDFVMGQVIINGMELLGTGKPVWLDKDLDAAMKRMVGLSKTQEITEWERLHVEALDLFAKGSLPKACNIWEEIILHQPTDLLALKMCYDTYFYLGYQQQIRNIVAQVLPHWTPQIPLYGFLKGMYSFGLVETNFYDLAEKVAKESLALNPKDAWSTHTLAHVYEMNANVDNGLKVLKQMENDWKDSDMINCHIYWHWALYHIEKGEYEAALSLYDDQISRSYFKSEAMLDMVDACSMLYRLQMEGINVDNQWKELVGVTKSHAKDHILIYNDSHILMSLLGAKETDTANQLITSLQEVCQTPGENYQHQLGRDLGLPICQAITEFANGNYGCTVDLLNPIRYQIQKIGGSNAQRDLFNLLLIHAALKSDSRAHQKLARCLLLERDAFRPNSPMTERLIRKTIALHNVD